MLRNFLQPAWMIASIAFLSLLAHPVFSQTTAEGVITEDDLDTVNGLPWGANNWDFSQVLDVQDALTEAVVGRVVIDRYGLDRSTAGGLIGTLIRHPFDSPQPNIWITVSIWGSQVEGCYVAVIFQYAPEEELNPDAVLPTQLDLGLGEQILSLYPQTGVPERTYYGEYTYQDEEGFSPAGLGLVLGTSRVVQRGGVLYMGRHVFGVDSYAASALSNAPAQETKARITFKNGDSIIVPIGEETVRRWRDAYGFNPYCAAANQAQPAPVQPALTETAPTATAAPEQSRQKPSEESTATAPADPPSAPPAAAAPSPQRTVGDVALAANQVLDNVQIRLDGAHVNTSGSYTTSFVVENRSDSTFGFVPVFSSIEDATGQPVTARITLDSGSTGIVDPGGTVRGQISIFDRPWNESGQQGLVLVVKESTTGGRTFRIPF